MALVSVGGNLIMPRIAGSTSAGPSNQNATVDADGDAYGMVFQAPATGTMTGFGVATGTVTTGDAGVVFALRNVDLTATPGIPGGTTHASGVVNVTTANTWYDVAGFSYAATQGELLAVTVTRPTSGTLVATFKGFADEITSTAVGLAYAVVNVGAGWVANQTFAPCFAVNYGGTYYPILGAWPMNVLTGITVGTGTTPDVVGNVWVPTFTCRVTGVWVWIDLDGAVAVKFYDTDGVTVLAQATLAANTRPTVNAHVYFVPFDDAAGAATVTPTVGATYRIGIEPSSATTMTVYDFTCGGAPTAAYLEAFDLGQTLYKTSAKDPTGVGSWTQVATSRVFLGVIIDQLDDGTGSGGGLVRHVGMAGGCNA